MISSDTICALATPNGIGALGIVRVSGKNSITHVSALMNKKLAEFPTHSLHFGTIYSPQSDPIDEVLVSLFHENKSFTGEESVEISAHGSPYILQRILDSLLAVGCRMAMPGEFTMRAFLNGKLDLSQAEAVADLIASESKKAHQIALKQLKGTLSAELKELRTQLIYFASLIELELDFSEEDVEFADRTELISLLENVLDVVGRLEESFELGNAIKKGVPVALVGMPNTGKSTLLNQLLQEDRAIVSPIAGTTRDVIEEILTIDGITFRLIDTAGIREQASEEIERIGIQRSKQKIDQASIVLCLADSTQAENIQQVRAWKEELESQYPEKKIKILLNKLDQQTPVLQGEELAISAKEGTNIAQLKKWMVSQILNKKDVYNETIVTNVRHRDALTRTRIALSEAKLGLSANIPSDLIAIDIRQAMHHLGSITGTISEDDLLESIFSKFCIGK